MINFFKIPFLGKHIYDYTIKSEGGMFYSQTLREYTKINNKVDVGKYSYGGCFSDNFNISGEVKIGNYCSIAQDVRYLGANHPLNKISTTPFFYNRSLGLDVIDISRETLEIGNDVWIGYNAIIVASCKKIGNGAVIGAGSVVTKDVPPYAVVVGNPAKIVKFRFSNVEQKALDQSEWWKETPIKLFKYYHLMDNPLEFVRKFGKLN